MADTSSRRLIVEVCNARNLMPKDGQGTASAYAVVDFDGQRRRTKTISRDLNPTWDEQLEFSVHDTDSMNAETLELNVYNDKIAMGRKGKFLGKVKITGSAFTKAGSEIPLVYYPLEKRSVFSQIRGEIGLKIWYVDDPVGVASTDSGKGMDEKKAESGEEKKVEEKKEEEKEEKIEEEVKKEEKKEEKENKEEKKEEKGKKEDEKKTPEKEKPKEAEKKEEEKPKEVSTPAPATPAKEPQQYNGDLEIKPHTVGDHNVKVGSYDLVERIPYLFVRLLKAKFSGDKLVYAKLIMGSQTVSTRTIPSGEWDQVFAFHKASLTATSLEVSVHEEKKAEGDKPAEHVGLGTIAFDLQEIPKRSPPDSSLAPQWYTLEGSTDGSEGCDVMLAVWVGTQVDESFQEAWQSDSGGLNTHTRCKAYLSPKLWYLRLSVIQTQDLRLPPLPESKPRPAGGTELYVKGQLGVQAFKTNRVILGGASGINSGNPCWNEDLLFVAAEPFDPHLTIVVEDATAGQPVGQVKVPLSSVHRQVDERVEPPPRWLNLVGDESRPYAGRVHVKVCLEGGYHVLDEAVQVASDVCAASKQLSKPPIGLLEVGVRGASSLVPMKVSKDGSSGSTYAYVVLKYGPKWARTRTIIDQFNPRWNEQYAWDVFDPCTVLTIAVFDNVRYKQADPSRDVRIGKIRIRLSTLDTNRVFVNTYPLTAVHPVGARKMGEIELAIRFSCPSWLTLLQSYTNPLLPRMHYVKPLGPAQQDMLRHTAMRIVSTRLARSEPPLGPEVVHYLLETDAYTWSMRRSKANWFRVVRCLSGVAGLVKWVHGVRMWVHPTTTALVHILLLVIVFCPQMILSTLFLYIFFILVWRYRYRVREPNGMDPWLSHVDSVGPDELDEEFDGFPSSRPADVVRARYDRIRAVAGRAQTLLGDVAAQGERFEAILNWRDPRATGLFTLFCFLTSLICYMVPFKILVVLMGFYYLRHPRFRGDMPSVPFNFFRRVPSLSDRMLCIVTSGAALALYSTFIGSLLPQDTMAMARDGLLPPFFSDVHEKSQVPVKSTILTGFCAAALAFFMEVSQLAGMVSVGTLLDFTIIAVSILILRYVPPNEVPLPSMLRDSIESVSLHFSSQEADNSRDIKELPLGGTSEEKDPLVKEIYKNKINGEKRQKVAALSIALVVVGVLILTASGSATVLARYVVCALGELLLLAGIGALCYINQDDGRYSFGHTRGFICRFIPLLPILCILINTYLLINLGRDTWAGS